MDLQDITALWVLSLGGGGGHSFLDYAGWELVTSPLLGVGVTVVSAIILQ